MVQKVFGMREAKNGMPEMAETGELLQTGANENGPRALRRQAERHSSE